MAKDSTFDIVFSDFDGTLFSKGREISALDIQILRDWGREGIRRVIATGRSYFSLRKVIPPDFPVDFVILSSGAGIMEWPTKRLLQSFSLSGSFTDELCRRLHEENIPFFVQDPLPKNHFGYFSADHSADADFKRRLTLYRSFLLPIKQRQTDQNASQFILTGQKPESLKKMLRPWLAQLHFIRATSPLDHKTLWLEILPRGVSKAQAARYLCSYLQIPREKTLAIGNDYNDLDLLDWAHRAFVMPDSPPPLLARYSQLILREHSVLFSLKEIKKRSDG